ncbi:MAG TPA: hypothetical protein VH092_04330 [Urbifossiella sp.]|jgi:hypothetical protein|nr:hypothetical protein [Urbifossiella sp.]
MTKFALPVLLIILTAVAAAAPVPDDAKAPVLFFPTKVGASWTYPHPVGGGHARRHRGRAEGPLTLCLSNNWVRPAGYRR